MEGYTATAIRDKIYLIGGTDGPNYLSSCEVLDTSKNNWSFCIPDMEERIFGCKAVTINNIIYVMGGFKYKFNL